MADLLKNSEYESQPNYPHAQYDTTESVTRLQQIDQTFYSMVNKIKQQAAALIMINMILIYDV